MRRKPPADPRVAQYNDFQERLEADIMNVRELCHLAEVAAKGFAISKRLRRDIVTSADSARVFMTGLESILMMRIASEEEIERARADASNIVHDPEGTP